ncbi:MAG TPA: spore protease YyaC [Firmicutes bacterium]|nr:spore protease YyaC [Bacillota bacterium]
MVHDPCLVGRTHWSDPLSSAFLAVTLASLSFEKNVAIVCVGTDRSTGDSLGPFIGSSLIRRQKQGLLPANISIHGTLNDPVHALNLAEIARKLSLTRSRSTLLAIDACLGRVKNIGYISVKKGPLRPGTGVNKKLPVIGDYHIIGVVNVAGFMEHVVLQNTRLSLVIQMAEVIAEALVLTFGSVKPGSEAALTASHFI